MAEELTWDEDSAAYIRSRGERYQRGDGRCGPARTRTGSEVPHGSLPVHIGHTPSAGRVLVVIAHRDRDGDLHGINAWPATGMDLKLYTEGNDDGQDD